ncbi:MAG: hypothetical protein AVDCRST_MAG49-2384 [uncultured Thermomicrobiales bacterium]|uniref:Cupin type-2 domain-containing protein n=1 Tax=uncultured Thermomicrobiales bacterium TaxID=1645740 RepID=A0A6J4UXM8_9BACT|nr:MAG: hypothetical protein AVDCRST_MAG49-2384 [uncultured Thermomicrobiales bacterium]
MITVTTLDAEFTRLAKFWSSSVVGRANDQYIKVAKLRGEFVWHAHADEDELFHVVRGRLVIRFEDGEVTLNPGDVCVVPKGKRHLPVADEECWVVLVEPVTTAHTGDVVDPRTRSIEEQLA